MSAILPPPTMLVTGASGWLGRRLVEVLLSGPSADWPWLPATAGRIRCLVPPGEADGGLRELADRVELVCGDVTDPTACRTFCREAAGAVLVHAAGVIHPRRVRAFYEVNVDGARNALWAAVAAGVRRVVAISSNSPCGANPSRDHRFDEHSPYRPYMHYGRSKMLMEQEVHAVAADGRTETVILRPPWFYGPHQPTRQSLFFDMIRRGKAPLVGDGLNLRSMCYVDNLCQAVLLAASAPQAAGQTYWIADARPYTMVEVIDTVERLLEQEFNVPCAHRRLRLPAFAAQLAQVADRVLQAGGMYQQKIHVLGEMKQTIACSIDKAARELGYVPRVELVEGMRRSLDWLRRARPELPLWQSAKSLP